jgi:nucleotide sugar dehydrogenase
MRVSVIGAGYVGLATAVCLAKLGHDVICADIDRQRIRQLQRGVMPFKENGLHALLSESAEAGRLRFTDEITAAAAGREVVMIAVGTPKGADGEVDLSRPEDDRHTQIDGRRRNGPKNPRDHSGMPRRARFLGDLQPGVPA